MRKNHHNPNKVPPFKPDPEHWTRKVHSWKAKVAYETEDDALGVPEDSPEAHRAGNDGLQVQSVQYVPLRAQV